MTIDFEGLLYYCNAFELPFSFKDSSYRYEGTMVFTVLSHIEELSFDDLTQSTNPFCYFDNMFAGVNMSNALVRN